VTTAGHWFALLKNTDSISTEYFFVEHLMLLLQHQMPTLIDCKFLKIILYCALTKRFVCQRRGKIMRRFVHLVKLFFFSLNAAFACVVS
jgi:hypothetical protein